MSRSDYDQAILDAIATAIIEIQAVRKNLTRIAEALEQANNLEANHPSRI